MKDRATEIGQKVAAYCFRERGNRSEAHLTQNELAAWCQIAAQLALNLEQSLQRGESPLTQQPAKELARALAIQAIGDCTCHLDCRQDSQSGHWHQHQDEPCPVHPEAPMVG